MEKQASVIISNYTHVLERIQRAAHSVGRDPGEVRLVVVTKGHPLQAVKHALDAGLQVFGENYAEEGVGKILTLASQSNEIEWHMIGHIQSRKSEMVSKYFDWVHSLDSLRLANRLDHFSGALGKRLPVLLECNVSGEATKFGLPAWREEEWLKLSEDIIQILALPNLEVQGLMTMAPFFPSAQQARPFFQRLRCLRDYLAEQFHQTIWRELSMGMSADFEVAVQEGATMVRIGTAIMGPRPEQ